MELFDAMRSRHSVRSYRTDPVPHQALERLIEAATYAPSSHNEQPWRFYVVKGEMRSRLGKLMSQTTHYLEEFLQIQGEEVTDEHLRWYSELGGAPCVIVCTMPRVADDLARLNKHMAIGGAIQNLLLAATDTGLAACVLTFSFWVRDEMAELLDIPEDRVIVGMITVGYPSDQPPLAPPREHDVAVYLD